MHRNPEDAGADRGADAGRRVDVMISVVIVEDEEYLRRELVLMTPWEKFGCTVTGEAVDGVSGAELIVRTMPDLVVTDIRMPGMDGIEMLEEVCRLSPAESRPVAIIVSGHQEFEYARSALRLGVEDYLLKPIDDRELESVVRSAVARFESRDGERLARLDRDVEGMIKSLLPAVNTAIAENSHTGVAARFLSEHVGDHVGLAEVARYAGITASYLSRVFSEQTGYTVMEYLTRLRIRRAAELLRDRSLQVKEVMIRSGYRDPSYFGQVFRRFLGLTPSEFRDRFGTRDPRAVSGSQ